MEEWEKPFFSERIHACPRRTHSTSFRLVDERGMAGPMPVWPMKSAILRRLSTLAFWTKQGLGRSIGTIAGRCCSSLIGVTKEEMSFIRT